jgi:hypothetical protein
VTASAAPAAAAAASSSAPAPVSGTRDLRLDFFRGLALWFIFVDHVPDNAVSWITIRNFGFSDATEVFIFISGFAAATAYARRFLRQGFAAMAIHVLRRCWQLYIAHVFLFVVFTAQIAYVSSRFNNPMYADEMNLSGFLQEPHVALIEALLLRFRPANMDVLPLYIVLLLVFPFVLVAALRRPLLLLAVSAALYVAAPLLGWNLSTYPGNEGWYFNPFTWQLLFVIGTLCACSPQAVAPATRWRPWLGVAAVAYLVFALAIVATWYVPALENAVPEWLGRVIYPVDKTNLDILRLVHFGALAYLVVHFVPRDAAFLRARWADPILACGRESLYVFCVGIFLSFAGHIVLVEFNGSLLAQVAVSAGGIGLMIGLAYMVDWYERTDRVPRTAPQPEQPR